MSGGEVGIGAERLAGPAHLRDWAARRRVRNFPSNVAAFCLVTFVLVTLAGCSADAPVTVASGSVPLDQFSRTFSHSFCRALAKCQLGIHGYASEQRCIVAEGQAADTYVADIAADLAAGLATYHASAAGPCIAALVDCSTFFDVFIGGYWPPACRDMIIGTQANGSECVRSGQCASGWCHRLNFDCSHGVCKTQPVEGAACEIGGACAFGLECVSGRCVHPQTVSAGHGCGAGFRCDADSYCDLPSHTCTARVATGAVCSASTECAGTSSCVTLPGASNGTCQPPGGKGAPCDGIPFVGACQPGLVCASPGQHVATTCQPPIPVGGACGDHSQCGGIEIDCLGHDIKHCTVLAAKGAPCTERDPDNPFDEYCLAPYVCAHGVCGDRLAAGEHCLADAQCASGLFCSEKSETCKPLPGPGEPCHGYQCAPDARCDTTHKPLKCMAAVCE